VGTVKVLVDRQRLPGLRGERCQPGPVELSRQAIYDPEGTYLGAVAYMARPTDVGTDYGWRPVNSRQPLATLTEAVERLPKVRAYLATIRPRQSPPKRGRPRKQASA
jgi:hypothetical protein